MHSHCNVLGVGPILGLIGQVRGRHEQGEEECVMGLVVWLEAALPMYHGAQVRLDPEVVGKVRGCNNNKKARKVVHGGAQWSTF